MKFVGQRRKTPANDRCPAASAGRETCYAGNALERRIEIHPGGHPLENLHSHIDLYCDRTGPEFWSEPVNALTNLAFVIAGLWGLREARRRNAEGFVIALC